MNIPRFTAEASLDGTQKDHHLVVHQSLPANSVQPAFDWQGCAFCGALGFAEAGIGGAVVGCLFCGLKIIP
jgi:hypothetical protein